MKPKIYPALLEAVESGVRYGYRRAYKHDDNPSDEAVIGVITDSVMAEMFERFEIPIDSSTQTN
jgi:hypothetical protein